MQRVERKVNSKKLTEDHIVDLGGKLSGLSLRQQIVALAFWPLLQSGLSFGVSFVDRVIAGQITSGGARLAVMDMLGVVVYLVWLLLLIQDSVATGAQALIARSFGAKDYALANRAMGQSLTLGLITGVLSGLILWILSPYLGSIFQFNAEAESFLADYVNILVFTAPLSSVMLVCSGCLRGSGDTLTPFYAMLLVNVVNGGCSYVFSVYYGLGIQGIALGTLLGWFVGAGLIVWKLLPSSKKCQLLVIQRSFLLWNYAIASRIAKVGFPQLLEVVGMWSIHAYGLKLIASMDKKGEGLLGSHGLAAQLESLSYMPGYALGAAAATLAGQYLGAGSKLMAVKAVCFCWWVGVLMMGAIGLLLFLGAESLVYLMSPSGGLQAERAVGLVLIIAIAQPFFATEMILKSAIRGAGATGVVMLYSYSSMILCRVILLTGMVRFYQIDLKMVWYIVTFDVILQAIIFMRLFFKKKWLEVKI